MDERTLLERAGWFAGRAVDIEGDLKALAGAGYPITVAATKVLTEFSGLTIVGQGGSSLWIDGTEAAWVSDPDWCHAYAAAVDLKMTPIGGQSHMTVLVDEHGHFWGGFDDDYGEMGATVLKVVSDTLVSPGSRPFDRELPRQ